MSIPFMSPPHPHNMWGGNQHKLEVFYAYIHVLFECFNFRDELIGVFNKQPSENFYLSEAV